MKRRWAHPIAQEEIIETSLFLSLGRKTLWKAKGHMLTKRTDESRPHSQQKKKRRRGYSYCWTSYLNRNKRKLSLLDTSLWQKWEDTFDVEYLLSCQQKQKDTLIVGHLVLLKVIGHYWYWTPHFNINKRTLLLLNTLSW